MKVSECIAFLERVKQKHGDVQCESDCPYCARSFLVSVVAVGPETARLNQSSIDGPIGVREVTGRKSVFTGASKALIR